ncbi:hypothetical protein Q9L58_000924 [Maublancomyces gigas]|uniref:AAA-ATPase-like domain-containing protein n=1 Tax=Discina gigas TaxID=1032678 RepID=A0ABR3GVZ5_9PEZI
MLEHFHGIQYKAEYDMLFKDLDVHKDVKANKVKPSEYFVLNFNFSAVRRDPDLTKAAQGLADGINGSVGLFYEQNHSYFGISAEKLISERINRETPISSLGGLVRLVNQTLAEIKDGDSHHSTIVNHVKIYLMADEYDAFLNEYMDPHNPIPVAWTRSDAASLIRDFWATVKRLMGLRYGIRKCFITGISPLSLVDNTSGFNIAVNLSFEKEVAGLCGLTRADIAAALQVICDSETKAAEHLTQLTKYADGYHFCQNNKVEPVFNTDTSLEYLQHSDITGESSDSAWKTLLLYFGGFTFDKQSPSKNLVITNLIAVKRFGTAILRRFKLLGSMQRAIRVLTSEGDIKKVLAGYRMLMAERDTGASGFGKSEENHRDSFYVVTLANPALVSHPEYKSNKKLGRVDLLVELPHHFILMEWKAVNIDFLDFGKSRGRELKAKTLSGLYVDEVLGLKFNEREQHRKGTIEEWIREKVTPQLQSYVASVEAKEQCGDRKFHAHLVLVVGSRHILVWDMDKKGNWIGEPVLV